jgi:hypothetical protein
MIGFVAFGNQDKIHQNILIEFERSEMAFNECRIKMMSI